MKRAPEPRGGTRAVTSLQNERVKLIRSLEMRKVRRDIARVKTVLAQKGIKK